MMNQPRYTAAKGSLDPLTVVVPPEPMRLDWDDSPPELELTEMGWSYRVPEEQEPPTLKNAASPRPWGTIDRWPRAGWFVVLLPPLAAGALALAAQAFFE